MLRTLKSASLRTDENRNVLLVITQELQVCYILRLLRRGSYTFCASTTTKQFSLRVLKVRHLFSRELCVPLESYFPFSFSSLSRQGKISSLTPRITNFLTYRFTSLRAFVVEEPKTRENCYSKTVVPARKRKMLTMTIIDGDNIVIKLSPLPSLFIRRGSLGDYRDKRIRALKKFATRNSFRYCLECLNFSSAFHLQTPRARPI